VITITGDTSRKTTGQLRMTTIEATGPKATVRLGDVVSGWFDGDQAVMPRDSVYPVGNTTREIEQFNTQEMEQSQTAATRSALRYLRLNPGAVHVDLRLADIGGPSAGLMFSLGIVDKLKGNGHGGDLTGGRTIAGTGTIDANGKVGAVGGVALKTKAARRDGASYFLVPKDECADAANGGLPKGLRLISVQTLSQAVDALEGLQEGEKVTGC
jgi:Lon-like protease